MLFINSKKREYGKDCERILPVTRVNTRRGVVQRLRKLSAGCCPFFVSQ